MSLENLTSFKKNTIEQLLNFLPYPFIVAESRGNTYQLIHINQKFIDEIGYTLEDVPTIDDWFAHAYPNEGYRKEVKETWVQRYESSKREGKGSVQMSVIIQTKSQGKRWYEVKASLFDQFQMVAFVNIHDVIIKEEELKRLNENNTQVLSVLAHDLRSPIHNLHALTRMALKEDLSRDEFNHLIEKQYEKTSQTLDLLDTTLYWAKSNFNAIRIQAIEVDLKSIVESVLKVYENSCKAKNLSISLALASNTLVADPEVLSILLRNLISNAIKFTPEGGGISISSTWEGKQFLIGVNDTGIGMTPEMIDKIKSYTYSSSLGTHQERGYGIGLQLCQQLVRQINGKLYIESAPGKGTHAMVVLT